MKKHFKRIFSLLFCICFFFAFALATGVTNVVAEFIPHPDTTNQANLIEYDYVNKIKRTISWEEIPDYSATTTTTYELPSMAGELSRLAAMNASIEMGISLSPQAVVDPTQQFELTAPKSGDTPNHPYSGVIYLMLGIDFDNDGIVDTFTQKRGTGFLVAPDVVVTAGHNIVHDPSDSTDYPVVEIRIYPYVHSNSMPSVNYGEFVYPASWICYEYADAINENNPNNLDYDWCVMKLQEPIADAYNFACTYNATPVVGEGVKISGYPGCIDANCTANPCRQRKAYQVTTTGTITQVGTYRIRYSNNTNPGSSGSPVYSAQTQICYAIHTHSMSTYNGGTKISVPIYNAISYYIES